MHLLGKRVTDSRYFRLKSWSIVATIKREKMFDAVKMMRQIRDKISAETKDMSFEELRVYIKKKLSENKTT